MKPATVFEKIWRDHLIEDIGADRSLLLIDRIMLHERTGGIALESLANAGRHVAEPAHVFTTMDHVVDTLPGRSDVTLMPTGTQFIRSTRAAARAAGVNLFDLGDPSQGIVHVISPEMGIVLPGATLVCPDSHTCSQGALGALAWGIGSTEAEHALATSTLRVRRPGTMRINVRGALEPGVTAKDLALHVVSVIGSEGAKGYAVEYAGDAIAALDIEARLTLCNMAAELSAFTAIIAPDSVTFAYLEGRRFAPAGEDWNAAVANWSALRSDDDAVFDAEVTIEAGDVQPMVTWGTSPQQAVALGQPVPAYDERTSLGKQDAHYRARAYMGRRRSGRA